MFFPGKLTQAIEMTNAVAATEVSWQGKCTQRTTAQQDYALALAQLGDAGLYLQYWCVPLIPSASVYLSTQSPGIPAQPLPGGGSLLTCAFGDAAGTWLVALVRIGTDTQVHMLSKSSAGVAWTPLLTTPQLAQPGYVTGSIVNVWALDGLLYADVTYRQTQGGNTPVSVASMMHYYWRYPDSNNTGWIYNVNNVNLAGYAGNYWLARLGQDFTDVYLLLPQQQGLPVYSLSFKFDSGGLNYNTGPQPLTELDTISYLGSVQGSILAAYSLTDTYVFAVSPSGWDWLQQMRLAGTAVTGVYNSAPVTSRVVGNNGNCDGSGCEVFRLQYTCTLLV